jgi:hypothetical protein
VGMAPAARVAFGGDKHMLAQGGEMMTTDRTAIRRRLAVRRAAYRPPWGGRKTRHGSIVASVAATLAATVAVGVGVALAKAERDRRWARERTVRARQFALLPGERPGEGLRRMGLGQCDMAIELLENDWGGMLTEHAVHETRKSLKRLRALIRLLEDELGDGAFARENALLRGAGMRLAGARDAEVIVDTLDRLCARHPGKLEHRGGLAELRSALVADRARDAMNASEDAVTRSEVLADLRAARGGLAEWTPSRRDGFKAIEPGLRRLYRQVRRRLRRAARRRGDTARAMHEWRKRVKDLRYAAEMLDRMDRAAQANAGKRRRERSGRRKDAPPLRQLARWADEVGELLGEEHDLVVLAERVRATTKRGRAGAQGDGLSPQRDRVVLDKKTRRTLLKLIARRRKRLRRVALREGKRLYRRKPAKFVRRLGKAYARQARA